MMLRIFPVVLLLLCSTIVLADTQITIKDNRGGVSKITSDGNKGRIDDESDPSYTIADYQSGKLFIVDPARKQVMSMNMNDMNLPASSTETATPIDIKLKKKGKGPKIAKYKTKEYVLTANGQHCGTFFGSKKLLKKTGVTELYEFMNQMRQQSAKMAGAFRSSMDICERAMQDASLSFEKLGAPMRILDANGSVESEVVKVKTKKKIKAAYYEIPADFEVVSIAQQINAANQQSQEMMEQMGQNLPNMDELMKQFEGQDGEIPENVQEKINKMQEMLKQYQQQ